MQDLERSREAALELSSEAEGSVPAPPIDQEDLSEYKFQKYGVTYFQGNASHQYQRKPLKQPLLPLSTQGDCMVSIGLLSAFKLNSVVTKTFFFL